MSRGTCKRLEMLKGQVEDWRIPGDRGEIFFGEQSAGRAGARR